jgi:hypothetical protein
MFLKCNFEFISQCIKNLIICLFDLLFACRMYIVYAVDEKPK